MELNLKPVLKHRDVISASSAEDSTVLLHHDEELPIIKSYEMWTFQRNIPTALEKDASTVALDSTGKYVFVLSSDCRAMSVSPFLLEGTRESDEEESENILKFTAPKHSMFSMRCLPNKIVTISKSGNISVVSENNSQMSLCDVDINVDFVSHEKDKIVIFSKPVVSTEEKGITISLSFSIVKVNGDKKAVVLASKVPIRYMLPQTSMKFSTKSGCSLVSASLLPHCAVLLFDDGIVHVIAPRSHLKADVASSNSFQAWYTAQLEQQEQQQKQTSPSSSSSPSSQRQQTSSYPTLVQSFRLGQQQQQQVRKSRQKNLVKPVGSVILLSPYYVLICYNSMICVLDTVYNVIHAQRSIYPNSIQFFLPSSSMFYDKTAVQLIQTPEIDLNTPPSLASASIAAQRFKSLTSSQSPPLRAHPNASAPLSQAAHAGGLVAPVFERPFADATTHDASVLQSVIVSRDAEAVSKLISRKISGRVANFILARCIHGFVRQRDLEFCRPLVDVMRLGIVSSSSTLSTLNTWSAIQKQHDEEHDSDEDEDEDEEEEGEDDSELTQNHMFSSLFDPLLSSDIHAFNVLEAMIARLPDLTEEEAVRIVLFAVRIYGSCNDEVTNNRKMNENHATADKDSVMSVGEENGEKVRGRRRGKLASAPLERRNIADNETLKKQNTRKRARQVLDKAVSIGMDDKRLMLCLRQVPFNDIMTIMKEFGGILDLFNAETTITSATTTTTEKNKNNDNDKKDQSPRSPLEYRGKNEWLDKCNVSRRRVSPRANIESCYVHWICQLIDAHFTNFVIGGSSKDVNVTSQLLDCVNKTFASKQALRELDGMTRHFTEGRSVPQSEQKNIYNVIETKLPSKFAIL